jgi:short-subunit dehydrogenase
VIVGASSGVGRALAEEVARIGSNVVLVARDRRDLECMARHLSLSYGAKAIVDVLDLATPELDTAAIVARWHAQSGEIEALFVPAGSISEDRLTLPADDVIDATIRVNYLNLVKIVTECARSFEARGRGLIVGFSSIAAAVPRGRNMAYSSAKAGLESYLRSLRHYFSDTQIVVQVFALGYVDTAMSFGQRLLFPRVSPQSVARRVMRTLGRDIGVVYYPGYWSFIIALLRRLPWFLYRRLRF